MSSQRYDISTNPYHYGASMERSSDGEWVDYDDHLAELEKTHLSADIEALRRLHESFDKQLKRRAVTDEDLELLKSIARDRHDYYQYVRLEWLIERLESDG